MSRETQTEPKTEGQLFDTESLPKSETPTVKRRRRPEREGRQLTLTEKNTERDA